MKTRKQAILESVLSLLESPEGYRKPMKGPGGKPSPPNPKFADTRTKEEIAAAVAKGNENEWRKIAMWHHRRGVEPKASDLGYPKIMRYLEIIRAEEGNGEDNK